MRRAMPEVTVREIAELVGAAVEGDPDLLVRGVKPLGSAGPDELSFVAEPRYEPAGAASRAGALLVRHDYPASSATLLRVDHPPASLSRVVTRWFAEIPLPPGGNHLAAIDPTASLGEEARLGNFVSIGARAVIGARVVLFNGVSIGADCVVGDDTIIYPNVTLYHGSIVGRRCILHSGVVIGADGYGFTTDGGGHQKIPQIGIVRIGDDVEIGANSTVDRATLGETTIGDGTKIDNLVQIGHNVTIGKHCLLVSQVGIAGSTTLGDWVVFGGQSGAAGHLKIGSRVQVASKSAVMKDWDGPITIGGVPARDLKEYLRAEAGVRRLPELLRRVRSLERLLGSDAGDRPMENE
jgi:UDP-3-O-[3-hydroxymyristoyl] glucosamine N-acyltransferase